MDSYICLTCNAALFENTGVGDSSSEEFDIYYSYSDNTDKAITSLRNTTGSHTIIRCGNCNSSAIYDESIGDYESSCHDIGISGNCGLDCPVLLRGDCSEEDTMYADVVPDTDVLHDFDRAMEILKCCG